MKNNLINLNKKFCLVTGSNGHIGKVICEKLLKLGATVIHTDIKKNKIKSKNSFFFKADLTSKKEIDTLVKQINKKFKRIDIMVNNASYVAATDKDKKNQKQCGTYNLPFISNWPFVAAESGAFTFFGRDRRTGSPLSLHSTVCRYSIRYTQCTQYIHKYLQISPVFDQSRPFWKKAC